MPTIKLTQPAVERLKAPASGRVEYWDSQLPGFGLRISDKGRCSWIVLYRVGGKLVRETLGTTALLPDVGDARELARDSLRAARKGINPVEARRQATAAAEVEARTAAARHRDTVDHILDRYLAEHGEKRWRADTLTEVRRSFKFDVRPTLGARPVEDITRRDVRELLDAIVARGKVSHAHHVLAYLRPAFQWAIGKEIIAANPCVGIPDPDPRNREDRTRDRYLDDDEIALFWPACEAIGEPFGPLFQLLLLTGQRRDELAQARRSEFDLDKAVWTLPRERVKNKKEHLVHLTPLAIGIIKRLPVVGTRGLLFTTTGDSPISGFGRAQGRLIDKMVELRQAERAGRANVAAATIAHFTIHDLRRSAATGMAGLGIAHHVVEKILNHVSGKISGVGAIYNRLEYLDERKAALETWSHRVETLAGLGQPNVVQLAAAAR